METTQTSTIASKDSRSAWRKTDTMWMLGLYGTAIGAGVLFLPINAGVCSRSAMSSFTFSSWLLIVF